MSFSSKELKKWKKAQYKLTQDGLEISNHCTNFIAIANGGMGNGVNIQLLLDILETFGKVTSLISSKEKSYAIATFSESNSASKCFETLQGHQVVKSTESKLSTLYFYYLNHVPSDLSDAKSNWISNEKSDFPDGLFKYDEFISAEEEKFLIEHIEQDLVTLSAEHVQEDLKHRQVVHYGYKFRYGSNDVDCSSPLATDGLPQFSFTVMQKIMKTGHFIEEPDQLTINKYEPGHGIPPHIDNPTAFAEPLASLSLGSPTVLEMKSPDGIKRSILLQPRCLLIFTGPSRYLWTHGIQARKTDIVDNAGNPYMLKRKTRISLTFRKVLPESSRGNDKLNSSALSDCTLPADCKEAATFEQKLVHNVYDNIAQHFSCTREKPWPRVVDFLNHLDRGAVVLDVGCGSGRYLNVNPNILTVGCDYCSSLIDICKEKKHTNVFICDGLNVPVRQGSFDACLCIAVIHHFSTKQRQLSAINELLRVVRSGGLCLIYVWAAEQKRNNVDSSYLKQSNQAGKSVSTSDSDCTDCKKAQPLVIHKNRTEFTQQDVLVPWKTKNNVAKALKNKFGKDSPDIESTFYRFYHVFHENELEKICKDIPNCTVVNSYYDNGNWSVTLKKH